jgi:hypothetical protein
MTLSSVLEQAKAAESAARIAADGVARPEEITPLDAVELYKVFDRIGRAAGAAKLLLAARVDASGEATRRGYRTTADLLAHLAGGSIGAAKSELATSESLDGFADTKRALLNGQVSPEQGKIVADAAKANPAAERDLLKKAKTTNHHELRNEAQKAKAAADPDPQATHDRIHRDRRASEFTDGEGAFNLKARGTVADGSVIKAEVERLTDEIFRARGKAGTTECREAYAFDALKAMAERSRQLHLGGAEDRKGKPAAPQLLGDAVLKLIITKGVDVANVISLTRRPTQAMHYALLWTSPTCTVEGCSRTIVEHDHRSGAEWAVTRCTRLSDLDRLCCGHHDLHTRLGWALVAGTGKRPMVPPDSPRHPLYDAPTGGDTPTERDPPPPEVTDPVTGSRIDGHTRGRPPDAPAAGTGAPTRGSPEPAPRANDRRPPTSTTAGSPSLFGDAA